MAIRRKWRERVPDDHERPHGQRAAKNDARPRLKASDVTLRVFPRKAAEVDAKYGEEGQGRDELEHDACEHRVAAGLEEQGVRGYRCEGL